MNNDYHEKQIKFALAGYLTCAHWMRDEELPDDINFTDEFKAKAEKDVRKFIDDNDADFYAWYVRSGDGEQAAENFGHNLWLSRNDHGVGFWDRGQGELGDRLHAAARKLGETYAEFIESEVEA